MRQFIIRRTIYAIITLLILSLIIFLVVRLTGDPVTLLAEPGARAEDLARVRVEWGLDRSLPVQYLSFLENILRHNSVKAVLTWCLSDRDSWLQSFRPRKDGLPQRPLPFDAQLNPKPAFFALRDTLASKP